MPRTIRPIRIADNLAYIPLTKGYKAIIDAADVPLVEGFNWTAIEAQGRDGSIRTVYAYRRQRIDGKLQHFYLHRVICGTEVGLETDHRDGDGLNNRRSNLRPATKPQNCHNAFAGKNNTSGVKGVIWDSSRGKWKAQIGLHGANVHLGYFPTPEAAGARVAEERLRCFGEFSRSA